MILTSFFAVAIDSADTTMNAANDNFFNILQINLN